MQNIFICFITLWFFSCDKTSTSNKEVDQSVSVNQSSASNTATNYSSSNSNLSNEGEYSDGGYCAEVSYYNPSTGTSSVYTLKIDVEDGQVVNLHWPNGGWLDESHFEYPDLVDGEASFTSDRGAEYKVKITGDGSNCLDSSPIKALGTDSRSNNSVCEKCQIGIVSLGERICQSCKDKICPICGEEKSSSFDDMCTNCKRKKSDSEEKKDSFSGMKLNTLEDQ